MRIAGKVLFLVVLPLLIMMFTSSCGPVAEVKSVYPAPYNPKFAPIEAATPKNKLGIKTAVVGGVIDVKVTNPSKSLQSVTDIFNKKVLTAANAILIKKGYITVGPFNNYDSLTFQDKKDIAFVIEPAFYIREEGSKVNCYEDVGGLTSGKDYIKCKGTLFFRASITIQAYEPLTKEKLLVKDIEFRSPKTIPVEVVVSYNAFSQGAQQRAKQLAAYYLSNAYESAYKQFLELAYNKFIDLMKKHIPGGEEAQILYKQAEQAKKLKRF